MPKYTNKQQDRHYNRITAIDDRIPAPRCYEQNTVVIWS